MYGRFRSLRLTSTLSGAAHQYGAGKRRRHAVRWPYRRVEAGDDELRPRAQPERSLFTGSPGSNSLIDTMQPISTSHRCVWQIFGTRSRRVRMNAPGSAAVLTSGRGASATGALVSRSAGGQVLLLVRVTLLARSGGHGPVARRDPSTACPRTSVALVGVWPGRAHASSLAPRSISILPGLSVGHLVSALTLAAVGLTDVAISGPLLLAAAVALLAGVVSFASPCVVPLVPGYLAYLAGLVGADVPRTVPAAVGGPAPVRHPMGSVVKQQLVDLAGYGVPKRWSRCRGLGSSGSRGGCPRGGC